MIQVVLAVAVMAAIGLPALLAPSSWGGLVSRAVHGHAPSIEVLVGVIAGAAAYVVTRRRERVRFLDILQHELSHLMVALVLGCRPSTMSVHEHGGHVGHVAAGRLAGTRSFLITIAPYWISPAVFLPVLLALAAPRQVPVVGTVFVSFLLGFALAIPPGQIHVNQPDLRRYGVVLPIATALWAWTALAVIVATVVTSASLRGVMLVYQNSWELLLSLR